MTSTARDLPDELWELIAAALPTLSALVCTQRRFASLWPMTISRDPNSLLSIMTTSHRVPRQNIQVRNGDSDIPWVRTVCCPARARHHHVTEEDSGSGSDSDDDDDPVSSSVSFYLRSKGTQLQEQAAGSLRELSIVTDGAAFHRRGVFHLTHLFEVPLPAIQSLEVSARAQVRVRQRIYRHHHNDWYRPLDYRRVVYAGQRIGPYLCDLYVWMLANQIRSSGPGLRRVVLDLSQNYLKRPFLGPLVDAIAAHHGIRQVILRLAQDERRRRYTIHDDAGDLVGSLRWYQIEPDLRTLAQCIPHLESLYVDCTGVVGLRANGKRLEAASTLSHCSILPHPRTRKRTRSDDDT